MSSNTSGVLRIAEQHLIQGKLNEAIEVYERVAQSDPNNLNIKNRLGELYVRADRTKAATDIFLSLARGYTQSGHTLKAIAFFKKTLKLDPQNSHAYFELGSLYAGTGLVAEAEKHYLQAAELFGSSEPENAVAAYEAAIGIAGGSPELRMRLAAYCEKNRFLERAHEEYIKAGDTFVEKEDDVRALDSYDRALSVHPDSETAAELISRVVKKLGIEGTERLEGGLDRRIPPRRTPPKAADDFAAAATVNLKEVQAPGVEDDSFVVRQISKAEIMVGFGQLDEALRLMQDLVVSNPDEPKVRKKLKDIYLRSGMAEKAAREYVELARIYTNQGDKQGAAESLASARSLCPAVVDDHATSQPTLQTPKFATPAGGLKAVDSGEIRRLATESQRVESRAPVPAAHAAPTGASAPRVQPGGAAEARISVDLRQSVETKPRVEPPAAVDVRPRIDSRANARTAVEPPPAEIKRTESRPASSRRSDELLGREVTVSAPMEQAPVDDVSEDVLLERLAELDKPSLAATPKSRASKSTAAKHAAAAAAVETAPAQVSGSFLGVSFDEADKASKSSGSRRLVYVVIILVALGGGGAAFWKFGLKKIRGGGSTLAQVRQDSVVPMPTVAPASSPDPVVVDVGQQSESSTPNAADSTAANDREQNQEEQRQQRQREEQERQRQLLLQQQQAQQNRTAQATPPVSQPTLQPTRQSAAAPPTVQSISPNSMTPTMGNPGASGLSSSTPAQPAPLPQTAQPRRSTGPIQGQVIRRVEPIYPPAAKSAHVSGSVSVDVTIDERGNVIGARAISGSGMLAPSAVAAARGFKFTPTTLDGAPVKSNRIIVFNFRM